MMTNAQYAHNNNQQKYIIIIIIIIIISSSSHVDAENLVLFIHVKQQLYARDAS